MIFDNMSPGRAYVARVAFFMALYVFLIVLVERIDFERDFSQPVLLYLMALGPGVPIVGVIAALLRLMRDSDEYVRALTAKRFVAATGLVYAVGTIWGFLELYAGVPDFPLYLIFAAFWGAYGLVTPFIKSSR